MKQFRFAPPFKTAALSIGNFFRGKKDENVIDFSKEGEAIYREDIITKILTELDRRKRERLPLEQQWILNSNYLAGNQFCDINPYHEQVEQRDLALDWLERESFNNIAPLIETRIANLQKINYAMKVNPATNELEDYAKADISTNVLRHVQKTTDFNSKKNTMIYWNELCGNCFWLSWWDKDKGDKVAVSTVINIDEDGTEQKEEKGFYQGELEYGLITAYEIYPESIFKQGVENQRSIILEQVKTVDDIYDLYGIEVEGSSIETFELSPVSYGGLGSENTVITIGHRTAENSERVITYFEKPSKYKPGGQMIVIIGDKHIVYYGDLPYSKIPIVQVVCHEVPGQFFGKSTIEDLIPLQNKYNACISSIHGYIKRLKLGSYIVEEGSIDIEEWEENGMVYDAFLVYKNGASPPVPIPNGQLPSEVMTERHNIKNDMEYVAGVSQLMVNGATPSGITSGTAISNLMEIDNTRLSLTGSHIRDSVKKLAVLWLEIYKKYAKTYRVISCVGINSIGNALTWSSKDINSYDVEYTTENELLMSEDVQKQRFFDAYNMGLFTDNEGKIPERVKLRALEFMKIGSYTEIMNLNSLQIQAAQRENSFFENGVVPKISDFDEHEIHIEEHLRYILQMDFQILKLKKPEYAEALENHLKEHKHMAELEKQKNTAMQIQGAMPPQI